MSHHPPLPGVLDLSKEPPRSPRDTLAGYVIAARMLDKCRAVLNGTAGEYKYGGGLDRHFLEATGIDPDRFRDFVAGGADDTAVADWIHYETGPRPRIDIIRWNNRMRSMRIADLTDVQQEFMEDYIARHIPGNRPVYVWFDVYDIEEGRI